MRRAVIDIGTNTILLLIAETAPDGGIRVVHDEQVIARLGKGVDAERMITRETIERVEGFLRTYAATCERYHVDTVTAVGTSAVRDARNRQEFIDTIARNTGITVEVLSGEEEAMWTYRGGISEFAGAAERYSVVDIGGGSTEIIVGSAGNILSSISLDIGSVRITERILRDSPPETSSLIEAHELILSQMPRDLTGTIAGTFAVGVAGTLTTLAALHQRLPAYAPERVTGYSLEHEDVCAMFALLKDKSVSQIAAFPQISAGRADIILAGILILMGYMESGGLRRITVSDRGLRYGILIRETERRR